MTYQYRLSFNHASPGFFQITEESFSFAIDGGPVLRLVARDADCLSRASRVHIEAGGYPDAESARQAGDDLRVRLQILNAALGLRFNVPTGDTPSGQFSEVAKAAVLAKADMVLVDSIDGLAVIPDDGKHAECIASARIDVYPNEPSYLFGELAKLWHHEVTLTARSRDALEILSRATVEIAPRNQFLLTYLACERMIDRGARSDHAKGLIEEFVVRTFGSELDSREAESLRGALGALKDRSFPSALMEFVGRIQNPPLLGGKALKKFLSDCISARNAIAHNAGTSSIEFSALVQGLRQFVVSLIWSENQLADVALNQPVSMVAIPQGGFTFRVR